MIERKLMAHYIDASTTSVADYVRLGKDLEELTVEMNAEVESKSNILGESSTVVKGYQPQFGVEPYYATIGDSLFEKLQDIIDNRRTGDALKTSILEVHLWEEDEETSDYVAYKEDAIIEVISNGGDTAGYQIPFNVHLTGNRQKGTFEVTNKIFSAIE